MPCPVPSCRGIPSDKAAYGESNRPACYVRPASWVCRERLKVYACFRQTRPTGADFRDYYELDDKLVTLKLTPNRGDCLGLKGIAREVSAITGEAARPAPVHPIVNQSDDALAVRVEAADACPLYCGRVIRGIRSDVPTPQWLARRLERSGMRTNNAVVDVTNHVMMEFGQPLHAFDLARISGGLLGAIYCATPNQARPSSCSMAKPSC